MPSTTNRFVLFAQARSGSTVLCRALQLHRKLRVALEPFQPKYRLWCPDEPDYIELIKDIPSLDEQLAALYSRYDGFKVLDYQLPEELYTHMLLRPDIKVIALRRRNVLQQAVSGFIAAQTGIWQKRDISGGLLDAYKSLEPIDPLELKARLDYGRDLTKYYKEALLKKPSGMHISLYYEDLYTPDVSRNRESISKVFDFLGLSTPDGPELDRLIDPNIEKINSADTYRLVPNAREIDEQFGSDEFGWLVGKGT